MLSLQVQLRHGAPQVVRIEDGCTIGKSPACDVVIKGMLVGRIQARIVARGNAWYLEDQGGIANTLVNGAPIETFGPLTANDEIEIGTAKLRIVAEPSSPAQAAADPLAMPAAPPGVSAQDGAKVAAAPATALVGTAAEPALSVPAARSDPPPARRATPVPELPTPAINNRIGIELRKTVHMRLIAELDLRRLNVARMDDDELRRTVGGALDEILGNDAAFRSADVSLEALRKSVFDEVIGLGPLEELIADPEVSEIMVNCHDEIFVERRGKLTRSRVIFTDDRAVLGAIERIVAPIGRRIDESSPMVDARLSDGSRVNAVIPPLALKGPSITIRKFSQRKLTGEDLIDFGSMSADMLAFLRTAVEQRANIIISGGTGSGKTTLLNVLSNYIPDDERIVTVEDAAELQLSQPNLVALEARPPNMEGKGAVPIRDLVKNCLRMRPDRIVVGECRGGEALDMLQAMNTGHDGSLTTAHANSPRDCIARLEVMTLMAGLDLPVQAIREQICSAVDIIVQQTRFSCGSRRVTHVTEVSGMESGVIQLQDVFVFRQDGFGEDGRVQGVFHPTSYVPDFYQELIRRRIPVDTSIFTGGAEAGHA
ncbi:MULTISPECIES: ATPase, T2SS/T4P/T4SS family [Burkholderia]|uniref:FHA domain-containing protein n=1 Tax=Burkholderia gladioli TaxID=28095 RepID=A0A2A7SCA7_BURGA|nr:MULTISPECIES: ATPase, T2SS/T4P/T4SS family [Burkholderia]MBU9167583.1 Flp pilus assembly complex ATPase component TadA [Burkholderia gladioli]MBU9196404.1 Flp pilus assembly complex ATPase component TadA [Burkholderia gladioli]MBU9379585.1 Flp pilus assembly complex ATPase component TadA [Burkholderia gladioli]MBU9424865.1 Flp pilus assembly complex ATPase component TadA [Burkholderia gladioli]MDN7736936.1 ATPase, T2SS/T4P/T4SS family [Burkholderia gladioli]